MLTILSGIYNDLKSVDAKTVHQNPSIQVKIEKIQSQVELPAETFAKTIKILIGVMELALPPFKLESIGSVKLNFDLFFNLSKQALTNLATEKQQNWNEQARLLIKAVTDTKHSTSSLLDADRFIPLFKELKDLCHSHISAVDMDFVMKGATQARKNNNAANKHAIVVLGKTGAGKSFVINWLAAPEMVTRSPKLFGHKLTINEKKQPDYLKHISCFGESVVSETREMGVVAVDDFTADNMNKFKGKDFVLCDTPGATDNRKLGPEFRLINNLQTVSPLSRAKSLRFLVIISATALGDRADSFTDTIRFVSNMFVDKSAIETSIPSMVFAINRDEGREKLPEFKTTLKELIKNKYLLNLGDEKTSALMNGLLNAFEQDQVLLIRPFKDHTTTPVELLGRLMNCPGVLPINLNTFAEDGVDSKLKQEHKLVKQSILDTTEKLKRCGNLNDEVLSNQIRHLLTVLSKMHFIESYYTRGHSEMYDCFASVAGLIAEAQENVAGILCPNQGSINTNNIHIAIANLNLIKQVDGILSPLIYGVLSDSRPLTLALLNAFSEKVKSPENVHDMNQNDWVKWLQQNRPKDLARHTLDEIYDYYQSKIQRLEELIKLLEQEIGYHQAFYQQRLQSFKSSNGDSEGGYLDNTGRGGDTETIVLNPEEDSNHDGDNTTADLYGGLNTNISELIQIITTLEERREELNLLQLDEMATHKSPSSSHYNNEASFKSDSKKSSEDMDSSPFDNNYTPNVNYYDGGLKTVGDTESSTDDFGLPSSFTKPSAPVLVDQTTFTFTKEQVFQKLVSNLISKAKIAIANASYYHALIIVYKLQSLNNIFGANCDNQILPVLQLFQESFSLCIYSGLKMLEGEDRSRVAEIFFLVNFVSGNSITSRYILGDEVNAESRLKLSKAIYTMVEENIALIKAICHDNAVEALLNLALTLDEIFMLGSLPLLPAEQAELNSMVAGAADDVRKYIARIEGVFSAKLDSDKAVDEKVYVSIQKVLSAFELHSDCFRKLGMDKQYMNIKDHVGSRIASLIKKIQNAEPRIGMIRGLREYMSVLDELNIVNNVLTQQRLINDEYKKIISHFCQKVLASLAAIATKISDHSSAGTLIDYLENSLEYLDVLYNKKFFEEVIEAKLALNEKVIEDSNIKIGMVNISKRVLSSQSVSNDFDMSLNGLLSVLEYFRALRSSLPDLYQVCGDPLEQCQEILDHILNTYRLELTNVLQKISASSTNEYEGILKRVERLRVLDQYIRNDSESNESASSFYRLWLRFKDAFDDRNFPKIQGVMTEIFQGKFKEAVILTSNQPALRKGSELRLTLIEQIDTYIQTSINFLKRAATSLAGNDMLQVVFVDKLVSYFKSIQDAQDLISAGLLSDTVLENRTVLLNAIPSQVKQWFNSINNEILTKIKNLQFSSSSVLIDSLSLTADKMKGSLLLEDTIKEMINLLRREFTAKAMSCVSCLDSIFEPESNFSLNSVREIQNAFINAKDLDYCGINFNKKWDEISKSIVIQAKEYCASALTDYQEKTLSLQDVLPRLRSVQNLLLTLEEKSSLSNSLSSLVRDYTTQLENLCVKDQQEEVQLENIMNLLTANKKMTNFFDLNKPEFKALVHNRANQFRSEIGDIQPDNDINVKHLVAYCDLVNKFGEIVPSLRHGWLTYQNAITKLVASLLSDIKSAVVNFTSHHNHDDELSQAQSALIKLTKIQEIISHTREFELNLTLPSLPDSLGEILLQFQAPLSNNKLLFTKALEEKETTRLCSALNFARGVDPILTQMGEYVVQAEYSIRASFKYTDDINRLRKTYSFISLRDELLVELTDINTRFDKLETSILSDQGQEVKVRFYDNLKCNLHFIKSVSKSTLFPLICSDEYLGRYGLNEDLGFKECLSKLSNYISKIFTCALEELQPNSDITLDRDWGQFNRYYQDISIFHTKCLESKDMSDLHFSDCNLFPHSSFSGMTRNIWKTNATELLPRLSQTFKKYLEVIIDKHKRNYVNISSKDDSATVSFLASIQKMLEDIPVLSGDISSVLKEFLSHIQITKGHEYLPALAERLRALESGYGANLVLTQSIFKGVTIALRNKITQRQDIHYVLKYLRVNNTSSSRSLSLDGVRSLSVDEYKKLLDQYRAFKDLYDKQLGPICDPDGPSSIVHIQNISGDLSEFLSKQSLSKNQGKLIWNDKAKSLIPELCSYVFCIWTLSDSDAFFERPDNNRDFTLLKVPHPAQIIAVFLMLGCHLDSSELLGHFGEVLTGQGKSIVLASVASILALLGFNVDIGCYSEYLSERDSQDFKSLFSLLNISQYIRYGTFNSLSENMLSLDGDIRSTMLSCITEMSHLQSSRVNHHGGLHNVGPLSSSSDLNSSSDRETVALVDEVDSLVSAFFGKLYQPYFLLNSDNIGMLLDQIWDCHKAGQLHTVHDIFRLQEYINCQREFGDCEYLLQLAVNEMYRDLSSYRREDGHVYYVSSLGDIYYKHYDGASFSKSMGYKTYWACRDDGRIVKSCKQRHTGIKVSCGSFSYTDMMLSKGRYRAMLGVTGTYKELSDDEKFVVENIFNVRDSSFLPSVYGKNKLKFPKEHYFSVVDVNDFNLTLVQEIEKMRRGHNNNEPVRPVLVFFDTEDALYSFYESSMFSGFRQNAQCMTSKTITNKQERDSHISKATRVGMVTLAIREHGRGSDFILSANSAINNGGMHVVDAFMPETEAEQRQHQGRAARQSQDGSFSMIVTFSELEQKFQLSQKEVEDARDQNRLYKLVSDARNKKFSTSYKGLLDDMENMQKHLHEPSMKLLELCRSKSASATDIIEAHKKTFPQAMVSLDARKAKIIILFDSTGSMGDLIDALQETLNKVVRALRDTLGEYGCTFALQVAHYRDYHEGPGKTLIANNEWTCDADKLEEFINQAYARGGGANQGEAVELGLYHANELVDRSESPVNHVLLIGDEPPNTLLEMNEIRKDCGGDERDCPYFNVRFFSHEIDDLANKNIPVSTRYIIADHGDYKQQRCIDTFKTIAETTGGDTGELDLSDTDKARDNIIQLLSSKVITAVAKEDEGLEQALLKRFQERVHEFTR